MREKIKKLVNVVKKNKKRRSEKRYNVKVMSAARQNPNDISHLAHWLSYFDSMNRIEMVHSFDPETSLRLSYIDEGNVVDDYSHYEDYEENAVANYEEEWNEKHKDWKEFKIK